jgi:UDP-N-acetylmuramate dehydrogenase
VTVQDVAPLADTLARLVGADRVRRREPLAPFTTFKVGGAADCLVEVRSSRELAAVFAEASRAGVPVTVLGGGSNVLIGDGGIRGLVIRVRTGEIEQVAPDRVRADAGVTINGLVRWTIGRGLAALEAWAGTPGTVGGAVYGNAHFRGRLIGEMIDEVHVLGADRVPRRLGSDEMEFGYDVSRLQHTRELLLDAVFRVSPGDPVRLRAVARESLAYRKVTQPLDIPSAGCIFQNPDPAHDVLPAGMPYSAGALIDRAGLKGHRVGGARVSPTHANFIVNESGATAADIRVLIDRCRDSVRDTFGVTLREEIVYLGEFPNVQLDD